jgi:hypothetical protein
MSEFTDFEQTVLNVICHEHLGIGEQLRNFLKFAQLSGRDNNGHGFYTSFDVDKTAAPIDWPTRNVDGPDAEISVGGRTLLMGFILWLEGGYPNCLEGLQYCTPSGDHIDLQVTGLNNMAWLRQIS